MESVIKIRDHIAKRLLESKIDHDPSPHFMVSDIFPDEVYQDILRLNPFQEQAGQEWQTKAQSAIKRQGTPFHLRKQIALERAQFENRDVAVLYDTIVTALVGDNWFARQVQAKYPEFFDIRFGVSARDQDFFSGLRRMLIVQRHDRDYEIGPHTDSPHRVFTAIFAFAQGPGFEQYGTQFDRPVDRALCCSGDLHHRFDDFETVKVADYAPNRLVVFFKTRHSFHSVRRIDTDIPGDRFGMQLGYYETGRGLFHDISRPDIMVDRTAKPLLKLSLFGKTLQINRGG